MAMILPDRPLGWSVGHPFLALAAALTIRSARLGLGLAVALGLVVRGADTGDVARLGVAGLMARAGAFGVCAATLAFLFCVGLAAAGVNFFVLAS